MHALPWQVMFPQHSLLPRQKPPSSTQQYVDPDVPVFTVARHESAGQQSASAVHALPAPLHVYARHQPVPHRREEQHMPPSVHDAPYPRHPHVPDMHVPIAHALPAQQGWAMPPQVVHVPPWQNAVGPQVGPVVPAQHGCPFDPHATHAELTHVAPAEHSDPVQQGSPTPPHRAQRAAEQTSPVPHWAIDADGQQGCPAAPHDTQLPSRQAEFVAH